MRAEPDEEVPFWVGGELNMVSVGSVGGLVMVAPTECIVMIVPA